MPRNPDISPDEYDQMHWQIIQANPKWEHARLARDYGLSQKTVARWRTKPWVCPVEYVPCRWCGEMVTRSTTSRHGNQWRYHPECRKQQLTEWGREASRKRFRGLNPDERMRKLDELAELGREGAERRYEEALPTAINKRAPWTADDDAWLVENYSWKNVVAVAKHLGRTTYAVRRRYEKLTKD